MIMHQLEFVSSISPPTQIMALEQNLRSADASTRNCGWQF